MIKIGSLNIDSLLSSYQQTVNDLDSADTGRNALGEMIRDRIAVKTKIELTFGILTMAQASQVLSAVSSPSFNVTYLDIVSNSNKTVEMYVGDRTVPAIGGGLVRGLAFNLIEV